MENNPPIVPKPVATPEPVAPANLDEPAHTAPLPNNNLVIQPVSDMSEYVKEPPKPPEPVAQDVFTDPAKLSPLASSPIPENIYPDINQSVHSHLNAQPVAEIEVFKSNQRVSSRSGILLLFVIMQLSYGAYVGFVFFSFYSAFGGLSGNFASLNGVGTFIGSILLINFVINMYLLISKNVRAVTIILTILLIFNGLSLANSLIAMVRYSSYISSGSIPSIAISVGFFIFLLKVRSDVSKLS